MAGRQFSSTKSRQTEITVSAAETCVSGIKETLGRVGSVAHVDAHVTSQARSCVYHLKHTAPLEMIIHAVVSSQLAYCSALYTCLSKTSLERLLRMILTGF